MSERRKVALKAARMASGVILAGIFTLFLLKTLWLTPLSYQIFTYTVDALMPTIVLPQIPVTQISFYEGLYLWSTRLIDTVSQGVAIVAAAIGAAILFRLEKD